MSPLKLLIDTMQAHPDFAVVPGANRGVTVYPGRKEIAVGDDAVGTLTSLGVRLPMSARAILSMMNVDRSMVQTTMLGDNMTPEDFYEGFREEGAPWGVANRQARGMAGAGLGNLGITIPWTWVGVIGGGLAVGALVLAFVLGKGRSSGSRTRR